MNACNSACATEIIRGTHGHGVFGIGSHSECALLIVHLEKVFIGAIVGNFGDHSRSKCTCATKRDLGRPRVGQVLHRELVRFKCAVLVDILIHIVFHHRHGKNAPT